MPCLSFLVFTPCPSSLFFFCHLYNRCCLITGLYLLIEMRSIVVVCLVFYPIRFASLLSILCALVLCFVLLYWFTLLFGRCVVLLACVCGCSSMSACCSFALLFVFSMPLLLLTYKHKKPYHFCFAIGYKKTRIYSGLVLKIKVNNMHYYSYN